MRRSKVILVAMLSMLSIGANGASSAKQFKIGVLDFQRVVLESKVAQDMNKDIEKRFKPKQQEIIDAQSKLESKAAELQRNESVMKESQIESTRNELVALKTDIDRKAQDFQRDLQNEQAKASKSFSEKADKEIQAIGKTGKFDLILQKQAVAYVDAEHDITDKLIKSLS